MKVEVYVVSDDDKPHFPGTAHVFIDGRLHAKLRSGEAFGVQTLNDYETTDLPGITRADANAKARA